MGRKRALTKDEVEHFKKILIKLRERFDGQVEQFEQQTLHKNGNGSGDEADGSNLHNPDMADMAADEFDTGIMMQLAAKEKHIIQDIDLALKKINDGTYGICEELEIPIGKERLKAMPYVRLSKEAQEEEEKRNKFGR